MQGDTVTEVTTEIERKWTEYRELLKVKFDEFMEGFNLEKNNVENLIKDMNLDKPDDNVSDDVNTEEVIEDVSNIENWDSSIEQEQRVDDNSEDTEDNE